jgi:hypothetical protein
MEVFVDKLLQSAGALLSVIADLKRNVLLNDFAGRNAEAAAARQEAAAAVRGLEARCCEARQRLQQVGGRAGAVAGLPLLAGAAGGGWGELFEGYPVLAHEASAQLSGR